MRVTGEDVSPHLRYAAIPPGEGIFDHGVDNATLPVPVPPPGRKTPMIAVVLQRGDKRETSANGKGPAGGTGPSANADSYGDSGDTSGMSVLLRSLPRFLPDRCRVRCCDVCRVSCRDVAATIAGKIGASWARVMLSSPSGLHSVAIGVDGCLG